MAADCLFCKIVAGEIPARKVFEDADFVAFHDIHPMARVHLLVVPKRHLESLLTTTEADAPLLGKLLGLAPRLAQAEGLNGFRTLFNTGVQGGQSVFHLHMHVFGGGGPAEDKLRELVQ